MRIEICGGIATGKTTLAALLEKTGCSVIYERPEDNPFLKVFYSSSGIDNTYETETVFTLMHYAQIVHKQQTERLLISDFSLFQDYCYGLNNLVGEDLEHYLHLYRYLIRKIGQPDLLVFTKCSLDCQIERIRLRNREVERNISESYVSEINAMLEKQVDIEIDANSLFTLDTETNDLLSDAGNEIVKRILTSIGCENRF